MEAAQDKPIEVDSAGVYLGMTLEDFGVRVSPKAADFPDACESEEQPLTSK